MSFTEKINSDFYTSKLEYPAHELRRTDPELYKSLKKAWGEDEARLLQQFKFDALEEVGLLGHPKAEKAFSYAWQQGHSAGYHEVYSYLSDIAEILL